KKVFKKMTKTILSVWQNIPQNKRKHLHPYHGLNYIASDGKTLAAHCFYDRPAGKSLSDQGRPYFEMCYNISPNKLTIASEPLDHLQPWHRLKTGRILVIECGNMKVKILKGGQYGRRIFF